MANYKQHRRTIKTGDILIWSENQGTSFADKLYPIIIRFFTLSTYHHVGVALWEDERLYVVEAIAPKVRKYLVSKKTEFYHINTNLNLTDESMKLLYSYIGQDYSYRQAVMAYVHRAVRGLDILSRYKGEIPFDSLWECAEMVARFYKANGVDLGSDYLPSSVVKRALGLYPCMCLVTVNP